MGQSPLVLTHAHWLKEGSMNKPVQTEPVDTLFTAILEQAHPLLTAVPAMTAHALPSSVRY